jgi:hypothetical protein
MSPNPLGPIYTSNQKTKMSLVSNTTKTTKLGVEEFDVTRRIDRSVFHFIFT